MSQTKFSQTAERTIEFTVFKRIPQCSNYSKILLLTRISTKSSVSVLRKNSSNLVRTSKLYWTNKILSVSSDETPSLDFMPETSRSLDCSNVDKLLKTFRNRRVVSSWIFKSRFSEIFSLCCCWTESVVKSVEPCTCLFFRAPYNLHNAEIQFGNTLC